MILILSTQGTSDGPLWDMAEQEASGLLVVEEEKHGGNHYPSLATLSLLLPLVLLSFTCLGV